MKRFTKNKKVLFGLATSLVLALAIGSFALSETQTPVAPKSSTNSTGDFTVTGDGTEGQNNDYHYDSGVLYIHPLSSDTNIIISNQSPTTDRIEVTSTAKITLSGVNISTSNGPALMITDNAPFDVNITLADGSENILDASSVSGCAGLQKNDKNEYTVGTLTIGGTGALKATGGYQGAGIGGGYICSGSYIKITGGIITATGGKDGAGIGGGADQNTQGWTGHDINITGGYITAIGGGSAAGIGAGFGGVLGPAYNNTISGNAVVTAKGGVALQGFDEGSGGSICQSIIFTQLGSSGELQGSTYDDFVLQQDLKLPANLIVPTDSSLSLNSGVTLTVVDGTKLINEGIINNDDRIVCQGTGVITTSASFYRGDERLLSKKQFEYKAKDGIKTYQELPEPITDDFKCWYYEVESDKEPITKDTYVLLNQHEFKEENTGTLYTINTEGIENGTVTPDKPTALEGSTVILTATADSGYKYNKLSIKVSTSEGEDVPVTESQDGPFSFIMPDSDVNVTASFRSEDVGDLKVEGGSEGQNADWHYSNSVLYIHPKSSTTQLIISNYDTYKFYNNERIEITAGPQDAENTVNITLNGVNINSSNESIKILNDANFNVVITLPDDTVNTLASNRVGISKGDNADDFNNAGSLTIKSGEKGNGQLIASGYYAGIGYGSELSSDARNVSNITIEGGLIVSTSRGNTGIGCTNYSSSAKCCRNIQITGGVVITTGIYYGIGGTPGIDKNNVIDGDAVVIANTTASAEYASYCHPLSGFDTSEGGRITRGIIFTYIASSGWDGQMHGTSVKITANVEFPTDFEIANNSKVTIGRGATLTIASGSKLTVDNGSELINEGIIPVATEENINCNGTITTRTDFYREGETALYTTGYQIYKNSQGVQDYKDLPNPDKSGNSSDFINWYYVKGDGSKDTIYNGKPVLLNEHNFHENLYSISFNEYEHGTITSDVNSAAKNDKVTLIPKPDEDYKLKEGSLKVTDEDGNEIPLTEKHGKYTFTMPASNVNVSAVFEGKGHEITIDQPEHGTVELDKDKAEVGDEVGFTLTPDDGYELKEVKVTDKDGNEIQVTEKDGKYTFTMPDSEVKIIATFEGKSHKVTIDQPEHGTVTVDPEKPKTGDEVTITLKPEEGYKPGGTPVVKDESGNEIELTPTGNPGEYKFIMPNSNLTIDVNFIPDSTPTPPEPTPDPSVNPDGDGSGASSKTSDPFMGGVALALLGVATTGAILTRKFK